MGVNPSDTFLKMSNDRGSIGRGAVSGLLRGQVVLVHLFIKEGAVNSQPPGRLRFVEILLLKGGGDDVSLGIV